VQRKQGARGPFLVVTKWLRFGSGVIEVQATASAALPCRAQAAGAQPRFRGVRWRLARGVPHLEFAWRGLQRELSRADVWLLEGIGALTDRNRGICAAEPRFR
jgi:hypothetical protein